MPSIRPACECIQSTSSTLLVWKNPKNNSTSMFFKHCPDFTSSLASSFPSGSDVTRTALVRDKNTPSPHSPVRFVLETKINAEEAPVTTGIMRQGLLRVQRMEDTATNLIESVMQMESSPFSSTANRSNYLKSCPVKSTDRRWATPDDPGANVRIVSLACVKAVNRPRVVLAVK
jgi:hypothetical protein